MYLCTKQLLRKFSVQMRSMWEFPISKIFACLLSEFCCNCSFKLSSASDSGEKRLDVSVSNSDDSLYLFRVPSLGACEFL